MYKAYNKTLKEKKNSFDQFCVMCAIRRMKGLSSIVNEYLR